MSDLINRQAAIDALWSLDAELRPSAIDAILNMLNGLPSVQSERKTDENNHYKTGYDQGFVDACKMYEKKQPENNCSEIPNNSDLISRQAAIDAVSKACEEFRGTFARCEEKLLALPSEQPEIIRCNSCKHWTQTTGKMKGYGLGRCDYLDADLVTCNGFCYWAERRNDG